jgi:hypothetical protein
MMRQALVALGPRSVLPLVLVGGAALALGALFLPHATRGGRMDRLILHAPEEPGAFYLSAWNEGDVFVAHGSRDKSITFTRRGDEHDGCSWLGTEKLTPLGRNAYAYSYTETILACRPDATPFRKTPRTGIVTVERWDGEATATALAGIQPPGDLWPTAQAEHDCDCDDDADLDSDDIDDLDEELADAQAELRAAQRQLQRVMRAEQDAHIINPRF